jgi:hypothetical protein
MSRSRRIAGIVLPLLLVAITLLSSPSAYAQYTPARKVRAAVATTTIHLQVDSSRNSISKVRGAPTAGMAINTYKWLINLDNTGNPGQSNLPNNDSTACHPSTDAVFPANCAWPSIHQASQSPVLSQGTQLDWNKTTALPLPVVQIDPVTNVQKLTGLPSECDPQGIPLLPAQVAPGLGQPCKFLVSVLADGFELGGAHFSSPGAAMVSVHLNPYPLPLGNLKILAYADVSPTDATYEANIEPVLKGFIAKLADMNGVISVDYYGNPLCTTYQVWQSTSPGQPYFHLDTAADTRAGQIFLNRDGTPTPKIIGGRCVTDDTGEVVIPNLTPGHYAVSMVPPDPDPKAVPPQPVIHWVQTTTLEGAHDFDVWVMANDAGNDTELVVGGEPVAFVQFGYVNGYVNFPPTPVGVTPPAGEIKGKLMTGLPYVPGIGGLPGTINTAGNAGLKLGKPVKEGWIALNDMQNNDQLVWSGPAYWNDNNPNDPLTGTFDIKNVPPGTYNLAVWDRPQNYLIDGFNITVGTPGAIAPAETGNVNAGAPGSNLVDVGIVPLIGWFTDISGKICVDKNLNSRCDPGEPGVPDFVLQNLNRTNNMYEQGQNLADTNDAGQYEFLGAYPLGQFTVEQAFNPRFKTTGITYQACNDPQEHTIQTGAVDISFLPIFGQCGRIDWAVTPYDSQSGDNGGIVATVFYDPIRQGYNARQANTNTYQTGIPNIPMHLLTPRLAKPGEAADPLTGYALDPTNFNRYAYDTSLTGTPGADYTTESYGRPTGCLPRAADGTVLTNIPGSTYFQDVQQVITNPDKSVNYAAQANAVCIEAPLTGIGMGLGTPSVNNYSGQTVDGNYALAPPAPGDWLVQMEVPVDNVMADGRKLFKVTTENDLNMFATPSQFVPQGAYSNQVAWPPQLPPSAVQMNPGLPGDYQENPHTSANGPDPICAGTEISVLNVGTNPLVVHNGGSPLEGQMRHMCDMKLIHTQAGQSVAPNFHLYTDVPLPTKFSGYITDDASISTNPRTTFFGEVAGVANSPIGIYDWTGRPVYEVNSDYNGVWEVLLPSSTVVCPTPSKFCPGVYRFVGNDPGQPGAPNLNHDPNYRVISAMFNSWPGMYSPADVAPTRSVTQIMGTAGQFKTNVVCAAKPTDPQIFAVDQPYIDTSKGATRKVTIKGLGFGGPQGKVSLVGANGSINDLHLGGVGELWTNTQIVGTVDTNAGPTAGGSYMLQVTTAAGAQTVNGVGFTVLKGTYTPTLYEVGPGKAPYDPTKPGGEHAIQNALDAAARDSAANPSRGALVVVYPNVPSSFTPISAYYENIVIHSPLKLQGVGPGGLYPDGTPEVQGSVLDGQYFNATTTGTATGAGEPTLDAWYTLVTGLTWVGDQNIADAEVIYVLAKNKTEWATAAGKFALGVDGFAIQNGNQLDFPGNIRQLGGAKAAAFPPTVITQGGALFLNGFADNFVLSNNLVKGNDGAYGAIRVGSPKQGTNLDTPNKNVQLTHNRIVVSGGTNLAGAVGMFGGSAGYRIDHNVFCGNSTVEYGGAISHYGYSDGGRIDHNQIYLNQSIDEGAGIQVSGELPTPTGVSTGSGPLSIDHNYIGANLAGDDGGGIRLLMAGNYPISIYNNMITNNVSLHEGGGIAIDDSTNVTIANNTIAKNITTATAPTSSGQPAPAGISSVKNSTPLQATLPGGAAHCPAAGPPVGTGASCFSDPNLSNNIFWDNRAGSWTPNGVAGVGMIPNELINRWDLGVADGSGYLTPHNSVLNTDPLGPQGGWQQDAGGTNVAHPSLDPRAIDDNWIGFVPKVFDATGNQVTGPFNLELTLAAQRTYFRFRPSAIVSVSLPTNALGDYHLAADSKAVGVGLLSNTPLDTTSGGSRVPTDIDDQLRPAGTVTDDGADQVSSSAPLQVLAPRVVAAPKAVVKAQVVTVIRSVLKVLGLQFLGSQQQPAEPALPLLDAVVLVGMLSLLFVSAGLVNARRRREQIRLRIDQPDSDKEVQS